MDDNAVNDRYYLRILSGNAEDITVCLSSPELPTACISIRHPCWRSTVLTGHFHFTSSTRKHAPTNCRLPALAPCDGHQHLEHWCAPVSTILAPRCVRGSPESAGSSGQQLEGHGYRPKVQSDHHEAILTVSRYGVSGTSRGPVGSSPPQQHHLLDTLYAIPF